MSEIRLPDRRLESRYARNAGTVKLENPRTDYRHDDRPVAFPAEGGIPLRPDTETAERLRVCAKAAMPEKGLVVEDDHRWTSLVYGGFTLKARLPVGYVIGVFVSSRSDECIILTATEGGRAVSDGLLEYEFEHPESLFAYQGFGWCIRRSETVRTSNEVARRPVEA